MCYKNDPVFAGSFFIIAYKTIIDYILIKRKSQSHFLSSINIYSRKQGESRQNLPSILTYTNIYTNLIQKHKIDCEFFNRYSFW